MDIQMQETLRILDTHDRERTSWYIKDKLSKHSKETILKATRGNASLQRKKH